MIAFPKPGDLVYAEWNPHSKPPRWEFINVCRCQQPPCGCCEANEPYSVTIMIDDGRCDCDGCGTVTVTPLD